MSDDAEIPAPIGNPLLFGQTEAETALLAAARSGRLPHAWLVTGLRGVGKATLAYRFARFLLSGGAAADNGPDLFGEKPTPTDLSVDPQHPVFRRLIAGAHPDVQALTRTPNPKDLRKLDNLSGKERLEKERKLKLRSEIGIDQVREAVRFLHMTSSEGGWRILIVDSADEMSSNAANALLKVLEEPPPDALLLLVSHSPGGLLPTIRSRCRHLPLAPLDEAVVRDLIGRYRPEIEATDAAALARLSEGSIGRALELEAIGGLDLYRELVELLGSLPKVDGGKLYLFAERLAGDNSGMAFRTGSDLLCWWLARMIRHHATRQPVEEVVPGEGAVMQRLVGPRDLAPWLALWENLTRLFGRAESASLDRKQVMVSAFLELETLAA